MSDKEKDELARLMRDTFMIKPSSDENWVSSNVGYKVILDEILRLWDEAGWELVRKTK